jgi:type II secretory pathway component PulJ
MKVMLSLALAAYVALLIWIFLTPDTCDHPVADRRLQQIVAECR